MRMKKGSRSNTSSNHTKINLLLLAFIVHPRQIFTMNNLTVLENFKMLRLHKFGMSFLDDLIPVKAPSCVFIYGMMEDEEISPHLVHIHGGIH